MDELISKIIEIEKQAKSCISEAEKRANDIQQKSEFETSKMHKKIKDRAAKKCDTIKQVEDDDAQQKIEQIKAEQTAKINDLQEKYNKNKELWIDNIFNKIIGA